MLMAFAPEGLHELLVSDVDPFSNPIASSRLCVTQGLFGVYESYFSSIGPTEASLYESFIRSIQARIKVAEPEISHSAALNPDVVAAGYYGGRNLIVAPGSSVVATDAGLIQRLGIRAFELSAGFEATCQIGHSPFERVVCRAGESGAPSSVARYFKGEREAFFYDRFINRSSLGLINYLVSHMDNGGNIVIATSGRAPLSAGDIRRAVASWGRRVSVAIADNRTTSAVHDRHIFVGRHFQFHVPRGLDIFGSAPSWQRLNGSADIYDCQDADDFVFSFEREGGGARRREMRLRMAHVA